MIVVQELSHSILSTYSAKQTFLQTFEKTLLTMNSEEKQGKQ